jgi:hypothetical protein
LSDKKLRCYYISNCWSIYGSRKVLLNKKVLILSGKILTVLTSKKNYILSGIRFTYKFIILDTKRRQKYFLEFLKYWPSSHSSNKLVIKAKVHAKTFFWIFFCVLCIKKTIWFFLLYENTMRWFFLSLRDLAVCMKHKISFLFYKFFAMFWRKSDILISNLYLYGIKIQTSSKQI